MKDHFFKLIVFFYVFFLYFSIMIKLEWLEKRIDSSLMTRAQGFRERSFVKC